MIQPYEIRFLSYQGTTFSYLLERKPVKNLNLRIRKDQTIYVSAPAWVSVAEIDRFVWSRRDFIFQALARMQEMQQKQPPALQYQSGESFFYMGKLIQLHIEFAAKEAFFLENNSLHLLLPTPSSFAHRELLFQKFWWGQCEKIFQQSMRRIYPSFQTLGVKFPQMRMKTMRSRWGSCTPQKGIITLNTQLLKYPLSCIDYVVCHEFCHFIHPNHSRAFYALLQQFFPDWKKAREALKIPR